MSIDPMLRAESISVAYGGVVANHDVTVEVGAGEIVGLIGPNGAGKTTFVDALSGFTSCAGAVRVDGHDVSGWAPHRRRRAGLARTWQAGELFESLTVIDNVRIATDREGLRGMWQDLTRRTKRVEQDVVATLALLGLTGVADRFPHELPLGVQKLVGVARALVGGSRVLLLDEPAAGLDTGESAAFGQQLCEVARTGVAILLIDHDMDLVFAVCTGLYVLDFGNVIAHGRPAAVRCDPKVLSAYLGSFASLDTTPAVS